MSNVSGGTKRRYGWRWLLVAAAGAGGLVAAVILAVLPSNSSEQQFNDRLAAQPPVSFGNKPETVTVDFVGEPPTYYLFTICDGRAPQDTESANWKQAKDEIAGLGNTSRKPIKLTASQAGTNAAPSHVVTVVVTLVYPTAEGEARKHAESVLGIIAKHKPCS